MSAHRNKNLSLPVWYTENNPILNTSKTKEFIINILKKKKISLRSHSVCCDRLKQPHTSAEE